MRLLGSIVAALAVVSGAPAQEASGPRLPYFAVLNEDAGAWPQILSSIGFQRQAPALAHIFVARTGAAASAEWKSRVERGATLILEGDSSLAEIFGFRRGTENVRVTSLVDVHE